MSKQDEERKVPPEENSPLADPQDEQPDDEPSILLTDEDLVVELEKLLNPPQVPDTEHKGEPS